MPKTRQTCTRCSMRRQKCDKQQPCSRCIVAGEAHCCTRVWEGGYDASVHRQYPKADTKYRRRSSAAFSISRRNSDEDSTRREHRHDGSLQPPSLDSDSDSWSSEHERHSNISGSGVEYDASIEDFLWSPDPLCRAMITDGDPKVCPGVPYAMRQTDPSFTNLSLAENTQKPILEELELSILESTLPNGLQILQLVDYHEENLLWSTHCYHGPTFRREVTRLLHAGRGRLVMADLDLGWCALLFAVLTSSLCCASEAAVQGWGFTTEQRISVSKNWHEAAMECLQKDEYTSRPRAYSVQAILLLVGPSHILGLSHRHCFMLGGALKIAQSLGLQRLPCVDVSKSPVSEEATISREVGRRIWWSLVAHDWTSIASCDMFSIDPAQFTTSRPQSYDRNSLRGPDGQAEIQNHILDITTVMMEFHVASTASTDTLSEYEQVWKHDKQLRELARNEHSLDDPSIPWAFWAKQLLRMKLAHKIIDIHRNFFDRSFQDSTYAWSRWASVEAAKTIIQEAETAFEDPERPVIWTDQAHLMVAGVVLGKNISRRAEEPERAEHLHLLQRAMLLLRRHDDSALATRAHKVLSTFLTDTTSISRRNTPDPTTISQLATSLGTGFRSPASIAQIPTPTSSDTIFAAARYMTTGTPLRTTTTMPPCSSSSPSMPLDPQLTGAAASNPFTTSPPPGAFDLPSISVQPATNDASWADMMPMFSQERLGMGNLLGFDDPYNAFG